MDAFDEAYKLWLDDHLGRRSGERRRRLAEGHTHSRNFLRNIWWEAFGDFNYLHPEYEWTDLQGVRRYIDLACIRGTVRIAIEIDGYDTHTYQMSRKQFSDQWVRHMHLLLEGWLVVRISADDAHQRPELWQRMFKQLIGKYVGKPDWEKEIADPEEREIIRMAVRHGGPFKLAAVMETLNCRYRHARKKVKSLTEKEWLIPIGRGELRFHSWRLNPEKRKRMI